MSPLRIRYILKKGLSLNTFYRSVVKAQRIINIRFYRIFLSPDKASAHFGKSAHRKDGRIRLRFETGSDQKGNLTTNLKNI